MDNKTPEGGKTYDVVFMGYRVNGRVTLVDNKAYPKSPISN
jgi:hypothetical protein